MTTIRKLAIAALFTVSGALLVACAAEPPTRLEQDFGNSVRQMIGAQKHVPPQEGVPLGMDGQKAQKILRVYREDIAKPKEIKNEIQINVGN